jgi:hypothetical protein
MCCIRWAKGADVNTFKKHSMTIVAVLGSIAMAFLMGTISVPVQAQYTPPGKQNLILSGSTIQATASTSGTTGYSGLVTLGISYNQNAIPTKFTLIDTGCTVTSWTIYSDVGPGGTPTDATATFSLVALQFAPGTARALSTDDYTALDASATAAAVGAHPLNTSITSFTAKPLVIPAHSYVGIMAVISGGVATTAQMNISSVLVCR